MYSLVKTDGPYDVHCRADGIISYVLVGIEGASEMLGVTQSTSDILGRIYGTSDVMGRTQVTSVLGKTEGTSNVHGKAGGISQVLVGLEDASGVLDVTHSTSDVLCRSCGK